MEQIKRLTQLQKDFIGGAIIILLYFGSMYVFPLIPELFTQSDMILEIFDVVMCTGVFLLILYIGKLFGLELFKKEKFKGWYVALIIGVIILNFSKTFILGAIFPSAGSTENGASIVEGVKRVSIFYSLFSTALYAPIMEEIVYRGVVMKTFFKKNLWIGLIASSVIFAFAHNVTDVYTFFNYFIPGLMFGGIFFLTKDLRYSTIAHIINNFLPLLIVILFSVFNLI